MPEEDAVGHPKPPPGLGSEGAAAAVDTTPTQAARGVSSAACPLVYPEAPAQCAFDTVEDRSCLEEGVMGEGPLGRLAGLTQSFVQFEEREITGVGGLQKIGDWIDSGCLALDGSHGFPLLFELLTGTVPLRILPSDDPHRWGGALLRYVPPEQSLKRGTLMSTLRLLSSSQALAAAAPKVEERGMGARMAAVFTQDGAIGMLLRRVQPFLRERARDVGGLPPSNASYWSSHKYAPPGEVEVPERGGPRGTSRDAADGRFRSFQTRRAGLDVFLSPTTSAARKVRGVDPTSTPWTCSRSSISRWRRCNSTASLPSAAAATEKLEVEGTWSARE